MRDATQTLILLTPGFAENEEDTTCLPGHQNLVKGINRLYPGLRVIILCLSYPYAAGTYQWHHNTVISVGGRYDSRFQYLRMLWRAWRQLNKLRKHHNITGILSCWCGPCALVGKYFGALHHIKNYIWILGQDARAINKKMVSVIRPKADMLIALSDFVAEEFNSNHHVKAQHVIPWGIDTSDYPPAAATVDIDVIGVGNLIPLKQYDIFIEVIGVLQQHMPRIRAVICGKGVEYDRLYALVEKLGLQDNVQLYGERSHREVLELMQRSRLLLHTSSYEGFGGVMAEALYAGAQVVSFVKSMNADIPRWHHASDKEDMAAKTLELLQQPAGDRTPVLPYTIEECTRAIVKLYGYKEAITS